MKKHTQLPLLEYVSCEYPDRDLRNVFIIACQHIVGTTADLFEELFKKGLKPENTFLLGKCYSTNKKTFKHFQQQKIHISPASFAFEKDEPFDETFDRITRAFFAEALKEIESKSFDKIIILDDGGCLVALARDAFSDHENIFAIEQTTSGFEKNKESPPHFPVINIARSKAKLQYESPYIAEKLGEKIEKSLEKYQLLNPNMLIIGAGAIGKALSEVLKKKYTIAVCDIQEKHCDFDGQYKEHLQDFNLIIGTTGTPSITLEDLKKMKPGTFLVSASSSDREFPSAYLRQQVQDKESCHDDFFVQKIILLNGGFPLNFNDGSEHPTDPQKIQLTRALLLAGIFEGFSGKYADGFVDLQEAVQKNIVETFLSL